MEKALHPNAAVCFEKRVVGSNSTVAIQCDNPPVGRYVRLDIVDTGDRSTHELVLCEVQLEAQVYGESATVVVCRL